MPGANRLSIIKYVELALTLCCLGLHCKSSANDLVTDTLSAAAFVGYVVVLLGRFIGHLMNIPIDERIDLYFSVAGCVLFVSAGVKNIEFYQEYNESEWKNYGSTKGYLAIVNGTLFLLDSLFMYRSYMSGNYRAQDSLILPMKK